MRNHLNIRDIMESLDRAKHNEQALERNKLLQARENIAFQREDAEYAKQAAIDDAYKQAGGDKNRLVEYLQPVAPREAFTLRDRIKEQGQKDQAFNLDMDSKKLTMQVDKANFGKDIISRMTPENYPQLIAQMKANGLKVADIAPPQFDPQWQASQLQTADSFLSQAAAKLQQEFTAGENEKSRAFSASEGQKTRNFQAGQNSLSRQASAKNSASKAPAGYRFTPEGNLEAIAGGPADVKAGEIGAKAEKRKQMSLNVTENVITAVDKALDQAGYFETGFIGANVGKIPGTDAYDLRKTAETIKANLGFQELQAMRDSSPTGGALGQVAVQELVALQSTVANIDAHQSQDQLQASLRKVSSYINRWRETLGGEAIPEAKPKTSKVMTDADAILGL